MIAEGQQAIVVGEVLERHISLPVRAKREGFERRRAALIDRWIGILGGIKLINDVDRLRSHAELRHE